MRNLLWLLPLTLLLLAGCEQFDGNSTAPPPDPGPGPGPDPDPDPDPEPDLTPARNVVFTPGTTALAGTTISGSTTGDPFVDGDTIDWTLTPSAATQAKLPQGAGPVVFPSLNLLTSRITTDSISAIPARWHLTAPGDYAVEVRETGTGYDPVVRSFTLSATAAAPTAFRPAATEITGVPSPGEDPALEGVLLATHSTGVSTSDTDGLGDVITVMARQTRKDTVSDESLHEFALWLGDVESGIWSTPLVLSTDARDRVPANAAFPLREYGVSVQQSFGQATSGRIIDCFWLDAMGHPTWVEVTLSASGSGALDAAIGPRRELDSQSGLRLAPALTPTGNVVLTATSGTPVQASSLLTYTLNRASGTGTPQQADIIRSNEATARIFAHDAAFRSDGTLVLATLERTQASDNQPTLIFAQVPADLTGTATLTSLGSDVKANEAPAIYVATGDVVHIAHLGDPTVTYYRQRSGTTFESRVLAEAAEGSIRTLRFAESSATPGEVLVLAQYGTGIIIENIVGTLRLHRVDVAADAAFDAVGTLLPESILGTVDHGPGNVVGTSAGFHVIWQQTGLGLNRNTRLIEARTG